jgi:uncharacterized protein involved in exopolysaccharide biosynthesis
MANGNMSLNQPDSVDFKQMIVKYLRYWYLFILSLIIVIGAAFCYLYVATPQYRVTSTLLLKNEENLTNSLNRNPNLGEINLLSGKQNIDNEIEVFKSKSLMHRVFSELSLVTSFYIEEQFKNVEIYGKEVPVRVTINFLKPSAYEDPIKVTRKTTTHYTLEEKNGKRSVHKYGEEITKPYGVFTIYAAPDAVLSAPYAKETVVVEFHYIV